MKDKIEVLEDCDKADSILDVYMFCREESCPYGHAIGNYGFGLFCKKEKE